MSAPRILLLLALSLVVGVSVWIGVQSGGASAASLDSDTRAVNESNSGSPRTSDNLRNEGSDPDSGEARIAARDETEPNSSWAVVRGFVVDQQGSPVRTFKILETHTETVTPEELKLTEGEGYDFLLNGGQIEDETFQVTGEIRMNRTSEHTFDDGTGAFEVLIPLHLAVELEAVAEGYGNSTSRSNPAGSSTWTTAGLTVSPDVTAPVEFEDDRCGYELADCLPAQEEPVRLILERRGLISGRVLAPSGDVGDGAAVMMIGNGGQRFPCDKDGRFRITTEGSFQLVPTHDDWVAGLPMEFDLRAGQRTEGLRLLLRSGGRLTGQVLDPHGLAMAGEVHVHYAGGPGPTPPPQDVDTQDGRFMFERLVPGNYVVRFEPEADSDEDFLGSLENMVLGDAEVLDGQTTHVVLGGVRPDTIRLHGVMSDGGEPVPNGTVFALLEGNATKASWKLGRTDEHGMYELLLNGPGNYIVAGGENVQGDPPIERFVRVPNVQEFELNLTYPAGAIEGTVTDARGDPVSDAEIKVTTKSPTMFALDGGRSASTDGRGRFRIEHLKPDTYDIRVLRKYRTTQAVRAGIVVLADRATTGVDFQLGEQGSLTARVVDGEGEPVARATVFLRSADGTLLTDSSRALTDDKGVYEFRNIFRGTATLVARKDSRSSIESEPVSIAGDGSNEVTLQLLEGTLVSVTTLGTGGRLEITTLTVLDSKGRNWGSMRSWKELERLRDEGFSSSERRIGPLPPGEYEFIAKDVNGREVRRKMRVTSEPEVTVTLQF